MTRRSGLLFLFSIFIAFCVTFYFSNPNGPEIDATGMVDEVVDGDTFHVLDFGTVRLADVDSPEMGTPEGKTARIYAQSWLLGRWVYLDVDDLGGKDRYGRAISVAYLDPKAQITSNFNRMLVDSGNAVVEDFENNEFDPLDWWPALQRVIISEVELNPHGDDQGREWVKICNVGHEGIDVGGWTLTTTHAKRSTLVIPKGTVIEPEGSYRATCEDQWLDNSGESIVLRTGFNLEVDRTKKLSDDDDDGQIWIRSADGSTWDFVQR